jgi:hypothetical protein
MEKELLQEVLDQPSDANAKAALLDHLFERDVRRPGLVASLSRSLIQNGKRTSRLDQWALREKLFISLLDLHELDEASVYLVLSTIYAHVYPSLCPPTRIV